MVPLGHPYRERPQSSVSRFPSEAYSFITDVFIPFRRILFLGYTTGLQIWDCTILGSVSEILNLTDYSFGSITFAAILATPNTSRHRDSDSDEPLIGVV